MHLEPAGLTQKYLANLQRACNKFDRDGQTIPMHGLTTVCHLRSMQALHMVMKQVRDALAAEPVLASSYGLLPPSSYHMTILGLISGQKFEQAVAAHAKSKEADTAASMLPRVRTGAFDKLTPPMRLFTTSVAHRLERAGVLQSVPWTSFAMRVVGVNDLVNTVELEPWDDEVASAIECWRQRVVECLKDLTETKNAPIVRSVAQWKANKPKGHYRFHMAIAYVLFPVDQSIEALEARQRIFEGAREMMRSLGPVICRAPSLCHFSSMAAFHAVELQ